MSNLPLLTMDERAGRYSAQWRQELAHEQYDDYWRAISYQDKFDRVAVPVLHISGWYDDELLGTPLNYIGMVAQAATPEARASQKLLIGPWGHQVNKTTRIGEVEFGPDALIDLQGQQLSWFDRWLRSADNGVDREPPVRIFIMGENRWRDEQEWPPARAQQDLLLPAQRRASQQSAFGDGALSTTAPGQEPPDGYTYDPARAVPFITEALSTQIGGPDDYAAIQRRDDVLVYATAPLEQDVEVTGPVRVEL